MFKSHEDKPARSKADRFSRLLAALLDGEMRARKAAALLGELEAAEAVEILQELVQRAGRRADPDSMVLEGALCALREHLGPERSGPLLRAAEAAQAHEIVALLERSAARRSFEHEREQWVDREMRAQTLGHRKQLARGHDRDKLARLATDQDPAVVRQLLQNPRCTEREAVIAASRRPARSAVLEELFRSRRWNANRRVRRALALNPYSPPDLAAAALALLTSPDLREVASDPSVSSEVRVQARRLLAHRRGNRGEGEPS